MKNSVVFPARSRFLVTLICFTAFRSTLIACCLLKFIEISLEFLLKYVLPSKETVV